jgi:hypothetical protein
VIDGNFAIAFEEGGSDGAVVFSKQNKIFFTYYLNSPYRKNHDKNLPMYLNVYIPELDPLSIYSTKNSPAPKHTVQLSNLQQVKVARNFDFRKLCKSPHIN